MTEGDEELIANYLFEWDELWKEGRDIPPAELCQNHPHLADELARRIKALKATAWLEKTPGPEADMANDPVGSHPRTLAGRYRLEQLFAEGGFAHVWKAFDQELQRLVAVKFPKSGRVNSTETFMAEARRVARLKHPGIVPVHDVGRDNAACFIVSEFVEGGNLREQIARKPDPARAVRWVAEVAEALHYAHQSGIIHRDIKPANILIDHHDRALLADFGIARSPTKSTAWAPSVGTLPYMPREQLEGNDPEASSDIYSLGVVLHELLTGKLPYSSDDPVQLRKEIIAGAKIGNLPAGVGPIVSKALQPDPKARYTSAGQLATDLRKCRFGQASRWPLAGALAACSLLIGIAGFSLWPKSDAVQPRPLGKVTDTWFKATTALEAGEQARAVGEKLKELNPGFDGEVKATVENGVVVGLEFLTDKVFDIQPVRALAGLKALVCAGTFTRQSNGILADLSPLKGMNLSRLEVYYNDGIRDLSPLEGMPLEKFHCGRTGVADLKPLAGTPLKVLICGATPISDLSPLRGMKLRELRCNHTKVANLAPLEGMPLEDLRCHDLAVSSLEPLAGMPLQALECHRTEVTSIEPLAGMNQLVALNIHATRVKDLLPLKSVPGLKLLWCDYVPERDADLLRDVKSLERINDRPAAELLKGSNGGK